MSFNLADYTPDVQQYIRDEWYAADLEMYKGEAYVNSRGKTFIVLEDAPAGDVYVKVECYDQFGKYIGYRPKIILAS